MNLLNTSLLNGVAVLIKTATMFLLNKILAVYVGPAGYAAIGQFQNFIQMITTFSGSAINTAIIKYTAEYHEDETKQREIWKTAGSIVFLFSLIFSILIVFFKKSLSIYIFHTVEYESVLVWFAAFLLLFNFNALFLAILNGKKEILKLVTANIFGSIFSLIVTSLLAIKYGLYGALVSLSIYQSLVFFVTLILCCKSKWFKFSYLFGKIDLKISKNFAAFALMAFVSVFFGNFSQIYLRKLITYQYDIAHAGYWDAMSRLSGGYLMFASTILGIYYLPRLAELSKFSSIKKEVRKGYFLILPIACAGSLTIFFFQDLVVSILFTQDFIPMKELFFWQLIGDVIKIGSWIISFMMLSKAMTKIFVITETIFALSIIPLTIICSDYFGFKGVAIAFALNCLIYWIVCSYFSFKKLKEV